MFISMILLTKIIIYIIQIKFLTFYKKSELTSIKVIKCTIICVGLIEKSNLAIPTYPINLT